MTETHRTATRWGRVPAWWLLHPDVDADRFCILAALATYADEHGVCMPSQATLAQRLKRSRPWVNRVVAQLAASGLLEKTGRSRRNGGTTSCLYRLRFAPPDQEMSRIASQAEPEQAAPDAELTAPVPSTHTPRQVDDTSHLHPEQDNAPAPCAAATSGDTGVEVPPDWEPSATDMAEALRLCPGIDLAAHTARFRARCRARGYRYRAGRLGDAWLAWLLEDYGASGRSGRVSKAPHPPSTPASTARPSTATRFAAWAAAAALPPAMMQSTSPWS